MSKWLEEEGLYVSKNCKFGLLVSLTEIKTKGSCEDEWCRVKCVYAEVERNVKGREEVDFE